jgi:uncharacterized protein
VPETIPLFPLRTVLLPGTPLPLHIFEPRYRQLTVDLITGTVPDKRFGVVALAPGPEAEVTSRDQLLPIGCAALLRQAKRLPDGRFDVVTVGEQRFRLLAVDASSAPYLLGAIEWVPDAPAVPLGRPEAVDAVGSLADAARAAYRRYRRAVLAWQRDERLDLTEPPDDTELAELAHRLAEDCLLPLEDRQRLLEETRPLHRLRLVGRVLNREAGILATLRAVPAPPEPSRNLSTN